MRLRCGLLVLSFLLSACAAIAPPSDSGVVGQVTIGPMCPVIRVGVPCPDRPFQASLTVTDPSGRVEARGQSDADGAFRIPLRPGEYVLQGAPLNGGGMPFARPVPFRVEAGVWTRLTVAFDSGIR